MLKDDKIVAFPEKSLFSREISILFFDRQDNLWIGSKLDGIQKFGNGTVSTYTTNEGLVDNSVVRIFEDRSGVI